MIEEDGDDDQDDIASLKNFTHEKVCMVRIRSCLQWHRKRQDLWTLQKSGLFHQFNTCNRSSGIQEQTLRTLTFVVYSDTERDKICEHCRRAVYSINSTLVIDLQKYKTKPWEKLRTLTFGAPKQPDVCLLNLWALWFRPSWVSDIWTNYSKTLIGTFSIQ